MGQLNRVAINGVGNCAGCGMQVRMAVQSIEVKEAPIDGIKLEMSSGRTVKGTVRTEGGGPAAGPPGYVAPVYVSLMPVEGGIGGTMNYGTGGAFTMGNVFPLLYTVNTQNLPANSYVKQILYGGQEVPSTGFEPTGDGQLEVILSDSAAVLEGSVSGTDGKPAGNAGIVVAPVSGPSPARTGNADAHGNFYFANLPPGDYSVIAWDATAPEVSDPAGSLRQFASAAKAVKLGEGAHEKVQVTVIPAGR